MAEDGSVIVAGTTNEEFSLDSDFAAHKLDANGTLLWKWQVMRIVLRPAWVLVKPNGVGIVDTGNG